MSDGSECERDDSNKGACLGGKCLTVGCDNILGSSLTVDQCGNCGGDGRECQKRLFNWKLTGEYSPCDKTCGYNSGFFLRFFCLNNSFRPSAVDFYLHKRF